jgi:CotH kinase protein
VGLALVAVAGPWAQGAEADEAASLYDPGRMHVVKLSLPQKSREELAKDRDKYQPGTFSLAESVDGTPDSVGAFSTPVSVEVKLKGSASYRPLSGKSAFKIRFPQAQPFRGLRYMTLNNMVEDPSMIHETLAYRAFRGSDVPASRTGYAYVYLDGEDYGVHLNIETLDRIALAKIFGSFDPDSQHLYESEYEAEVLPGREWMFEIDEGDDDRSDLEALVARVNSNGPSSWAQHVAPVADLAEMTRMWAVEKYIGQWDGYAGMEASWLPNNYYLYSDPGGVFQMLPWGNDESFQQASHLDFDGPAGLMFDRCLEDAVCGVTYRQSVAAVRDAIAGMNLDALAVQSAALLDPWQEMEDEESSREEWDLEEVDAGVAETRAFIASRPAEATAWLNGEEPQQQGSGPPVSVPGASQVAGAVARPRALRVGKARLARGTLHTRVQLGSGGTIVQRGKVSTGEGARVVCRDRAQAERARAVTLRCSLPASIRERLRSGPVGITLAIRFTPAGGSPQNLSRWVVLPRA